MNSAYSFKKPSIYGSSSSKDNLKPIFFSSLAFNIKQYQIPVWAVNSS